MKTIIKKEKSLMAMHNPAHPGEVLKELWLEPMGITVTDAAARLRVARKTVSQIVNGRGPITPEMALRIEIVFGSTAEIWLNMQAAFDIWQMRIIRKSLQGTLRNIRSGGSLIGTSGGVLRNLQQGRK